jgi:hypothetical protein
MICVRAFRGSEKYECRTLDRFVGTLCINWATRMLAYCSWQHTWGPVLSRENKKKGKRKGAGTDKEKLVRYFLNIN